MSYADQIRNEPNAYNMRELIADGIEENKNTADGAVNTATQIGQQAVNIATDKGNNAITTANEAKTQTQSNTDQIANIVAHNGDGTKDTEIVDSRHDNISNVSYESLGKRLDGVSSHLADIAKLGYANTNFDNMKDRFESILVNVKDFGAIGDSESHPLSNKFSTLTEAQLIYPNAQSLDDEIDTVAIEQCIRYCIEYKKTCYIPQGIYIINRSIKANPSTNILQDLCILGSYSTPKYNNYQMKTILKTSNIFPLTANIIDLTYISGIYCRLFSILGINDVNGTTSIEFGIPFDGQTANNNDIQFCNLDTNKIGIKFTNSGNNHLKNNYVSNCYYAGIFAVRNAGDCDYIDNYINTNNADYSGTDIYTGSGILIGTNCNNSTIYGGKIEWNGKGITCYGSQGIIIGFIQFDHNGCWNIYMEATGDEQNDNITFSIVGNRYLSGGDKNNGSHIIIKSTNNNMKGTIIGSTFRKGGGSAYDNNQGDNIGPAYAGINISGNGGEITICGNDMLDCASIASIVVSGNIKVHEEGNVINLPIEKYNNALIIKETNANLSKVVYESSVPTSGVWNKGDIIKNTNQIEQGATGSKYVISQWYCDVAGEPGTWSERHMLTGN